MIDWLANHRRSTDSVCDQGLRRVCLSLALTYIHERATSLELSSEYLHWASANRGGRGTIAGAAGALELDGQPPAEQWPFDLSIDDTLASYAPPPGVVGGYARATISHIANIDGVAQALVDGSLVALALKTSPQWYTSRPRVINEGVPHVALHAVVALGVGILRDPLPPELVAGERVIYLRNSWGPDWGVQGHALLTEKAFTESVDWALAI